MFSFQKDWKYLNYDLIKIDRMKLSIRYKIELIIIIIITIIIIIMRSNVFLAKKKMCHSLSFY